MTKRVAMLFTVMLALAVLLVGGTGTAAQPLSPQVTPDVPEGPATAGVEEVAGPADAEAALALATTRISVSSAGVEGNNESEFPALSNDCLLYTSPSPRD